MGPQTHQSGERLGAPRLFAAAVAFMIGLHLLEPGARLLAEPWVWSGVIPAVAGFGLYLWADWTFRRHGVSSGIAPNAWAAAIFKHVPEPGLPADECRALVTGGPFRFSRHPMFLGMTLAILGLGLGLGTAAPLLVAIVFPVILDRLHVVPEEVQLDETHGEAWRAYASRVRRWL